MTTNADKHAELAQALREQFRFDPFIGPIRDPNLPHDPPNPSPLSVITLKSHGDYEKVAEEHHIAQSRRSQGMIEYVVRHKPTDTYWRTYYDIRMDDSDADQPARWSQVQPRKVEIVVYDQVK